jgi:hypothetical protein
MFRIHEITLALPAVFVLEDQFDITERLKGCNRFKDVKD